MSLVKAFNRTVPLAGLALLSACAVGPDYHPPAAQPHTGGALVEARGGGADTAAAPDPNWWEMFEDPALSRLVQDALAYNLDVRAASANLRRARAVLSEARAGRLPGTDLSASYQRNRVGADSLGAGGGLSPAAPGGATHTDFDYFQTGFDASYELDVFGRVSRSIEAARADAQAQQAELDGVRISIAAQVAQDYVDACGNAAQSDVAQETARLQRNTLGLTQRLLDAGRGTRRNVDQATILVAQAEAQVPDLEAERRAQLYALAVLTGRPPSEIDAAADRCRSVPRVRTAIPVGDGGALLARRPDVRRAERTLAADTARIGIATAALFPSVTLAGSATLGAPRIGGIGKPASFSYSFGPLISWSFPNIAVARARIREARGQSEASLDTFQGTLLVALKETEQALARSSAAQEQNAALGRAAAAAEDAARLSRLRFDQGRDNFLNLLVAEQDRAAARRALAQSDTKVADMQVSLFKALGGGWEHAPAVQPGIAAPPDRGDMEHHADAGKTSSP